jgi:peptidoglycan/xylan/chitin deacetylase (PgdA/CDA1 family)
VSPDSVERCLVLHAERLERDDVWRRTTSLLSALEARDGRATVFVHPYTAIRAGADLGARIAELSGRGHEVAQHTHYYAADPPDAPASRPVTDLSDENVRRCLERDRRYLREAGADPVGFTAGAWVEHAEAGRWLAQAGFRYDCTGRSFDLRHAASGVDPRGRRRAAAMDGPVVDLPTTDSLGGAARRIVGSGPATLPVGAARYSLVYLHDYDLVRWRYRAAARATIARVRGPWRTAGHVVEAFTRASAR